MVRSRALWLVSLLLAASQAFAAGGFASMPSVVASYPALTPLQTRVAQAYFAVLGRIPDAAPVSGALTSDAGAASFCALPAQNGFDFWYCAAFRSPYGVNATTGQIVDIIGTGMANANLIPLNEVFTGPGGAFGSAGTKNGSTYTLDPGFGDFVAYVYTFMLGRSIDDDPDGERYWHQRAIDVAYQADPVNHYADPGETVDAILNAVVSLAQVPSADFDAAGNCLAGPPFYCRYAYQFANQSKMLEAGVRLQRGRNRMLQYQDSETLLRRVTDNPTSFNDAFTKLDALTNGQAAINCSLPCWEAPGGFTYTTSKINNEAQALYSNPNVRAHKYLVWYNRAGRMMLAQAFLPGPWPSTKYNSIVSVHGGGWRGGTIEELQRYNWNFANPGNTYGSFVVFAPSYALSANTYTAPAQQNDVDDFLKLVSSAPTRNAFNVTSTVHKFGVSAGGHLLDLLAVKSNQGRVATISPPGDLTNPSSGLRDYVDRYLNGASASNNSPNLNGSPGIATSFYIQHGKLDALVPDTQSQDFQTRYASAQVCFLPGVGHTLYNPFVAGTVDYSAFNAAVSRLLVFFATGSKDMTGCDTAP
jgi:acetyl esterase/lipase